MRNSVIRLFCARTLSTRFIISNALILIINFRSLTDTKMNETRERERREATTTKKGELELFGELHTHTYAFIYIYERSRFITQKSLNHLLSLHWKQLAAFVLERSYCFSCV